MNIVWLSWKDRRHPLAGGAEKVSGEIMDRLVSNGHHVKLITSKYDTSNEYDKLSDGMEIYRGGSRYTVYVNAHRIFKKVGQDWADIVVDEMNTLPFYAGFYSKNTINILLSYQLARKVWFYELPLPFSLIGYLLEPSMIRVLSHLDYSVVATESLSSKNDMHRHGLRNIELFRVGISEPPLKSLGHKSSNTILSLGALRPMKRTLDAVKAFEAARDQNSDITMVVAGNNTSPYGRNVVEYIEKSRHSSAITVLGHVTNAKRKSLMRNAKLILVTSIKEGWGLIVTEANSQGTPAIVYDTDGLRDSVMSDETGIVVPNGDYIAMGDAVNRLIQDGELYAKYRKSAWEMSKDYTFENSYEDFWNILSRVIDEKK